MRESDVLAQHQGGGCTVVDGNGTSSPGIGAFVGGFIGFLIALYCLRVIVGCLRVSIDDRSC